VLRSYILLDLYTTAPPSQQQLSSCAIKTL